jgi:uncharacterized membrane protein YfcA
VDADLVAAGVIVVLAGIITGLAGFGFGVVSVPPLLFIYDPPTVVALGMILTWTGGWVPLLEVWREVRVPKLARLLPWAVFGLFLGALALRLAPAPYLKFAASVAVLAFALLLLRRGTTQPGPKRSWELPLAGLSSGTLSTATGLAGPPVVMLFTLRDLPVPAFRANMIAYLVVIDAIGHPTLVAQGILTQSHLLTGAILAPIAIVGRVVGMRLARRVSVPTFRRLTLGLLVTTGLLGSVNAVPSLLG